MKRIAVLGLAVAALAGCGGGGGDSPSTPSNPAPAQVEAQNIWKSILSADRTYTTRGTGSDGAAYEISTNIRVRGPIQFANNTTTAPSTHNSVEVNTAVKRNNVAYSNTSLLLAVRPADLSLAGALDPVNGTCVAPDSSTQTPPVPTTAALNASGSLLSGAEYVYSSTSSQCTRNNVLRAPAHNLTWSYEADAGRPLFCINYATTNPGDNRMQTNCIEVAQGNNVAGTARVTLSAGQLTLTAKNY
ncbi:hypothetical protein [Acidovorax sp. Root219]|uniref:hypothetical protein n=1 Tax=Acidovorax sp. Root219 TaxID=1736493 RepID=UPI000A8A95C6|nr:hypothetical protein [Acidovorax sp. Root219]